MDLQDLDDVLAAMMAFKDGVSDINFTVGKPPQLEVDGVLEEMTFATRPEPLTPEETHAISIALMAGDPTAAERLEAVGSCDTAHRLADGRRVRVNVFRARGEYSVVLRALPSEVPSIERLSLPDTLRQIVDQKDGLVLVTGATGAGKSTTITAILDAINRTRPVHVLTLEDPIEFEHSHDRATINQRELGQDFSDYADGLRAAMRQAPKVIFVGEIRDRESMEIVLKAAETGHLVLSTMHTIDAGATIGRIAGLFEVNEQPVVRARLAEVLRFVVGQRLLPKVGGGRVAALEIMGNNLRVRELMLEGENATKTFYGVIHDQKGKGWQTFDQHIVSLFADELVTADVAKRAATDTAVVSREIDRVMSRRGEDTSDLGDLEMAYRRRAQ